MPSNLLEYRRGRERANAHPPLTRTHSIKVNGGAAMQSNDAPEEWRPVVGFEGLYEVSSHGQVKRVPRSVNTGCGGIWNLEERMVSQWKNIHGYRFVSFSHRGKRSHRAVHRAVAEAFIGPRPSGAYVLHWDDDKENNFRSNLRYGSPEDNCEDRVRNGNDRNSRKKSCPRGHSYSGDNLIQKGSGRECRACKRTRDFVAKHPGRKNDFDAIADHHYRELIKGWQEVTE